MTSMLNFPGTINVEYLVKFLNKSSTVIQSCFNPLSFYVNLSCQDQVIDWLHDLPASSYDVVLNSPDMHYMEVSFTEKQQAVAFKLTFVT